MKDTRSALREISGPLSDFHIKLAGKHGDVWLRAFKKFLRKEDPWPELARVIRDELKVWKTIKLGTGLKTADDFKEAINKKGYLLGDEASSVLCSQDFESEEKEIEVDLVIVPISRLGFSDDVTLDRIHDRAFCGLGLDLCPPEVGPQLLLQYPDQPNDEWLFVAMESIVRPGGSKFEFCVGCHDLRDGRRGLHGDFIEPGLQWASDFKFVFVKPRDKFPVWKTIELGTGLRSTDDFLNALGTARCNTPSEASDILAKPQFEISSKKTEVDLVIASARDLGLTVENPTLGQIYDQAIELCLDICPAEVGPQLRLQYLDQPDGEWLHMAMVPIGGSDSRLHVFSVRKNISVLWLTTESFKDFHSCPRATDRFVFVKPRRD